MDKFEFSDLYKFLVSAGIILIALSVLLPWVYLKEPFDLLIETNKIKLLTPQAQNIISERQVLIGKVYSMIPYLSGTFLTMGTFSVCYGLYKWFGKQLDIDKRDLLTTLKLKNEVEGMTIAELEAKSTKEFEEASVNVDEQATTTTTTTILPITEMPSKERFISYYLQAEQILVNKLTTFYQDRYRIFANVKIEHFYYDLVLSSIYSNNKDLIFEFKYFPNLTHRLIRETLIALDISKDGYIENIRVKASAILLIVIPPNTFSDEELRNFKAEVIPPSVEGIRFEFVSLDKTDKLDADFFDKLIL